jgi:hypothetical protein
MKFAFAAFLVTLVASAAWAGNDCSDPATWEHLKPQKSAAECRAMIEKVVKSCDPGSSDTTIAMVARIGNEGGCIEHVLNTELDKRLLPLKKKNADEFKKEMLVQADYKKMADSVCGAMNSCDGSMYRITGTQCRLTVTNWRLKQAQDLNGPKIRLPAVKEKSKFSDPDLTTFSKSFCSMSDDVFAGKRPSDCELRISNDLLRAAGSNCHDEDNADGY